MTKLKTIKLLLTALSYNHYHLGIKYIKDVESMRKKNGLKYTIKYYKAVKLHITRYICSTPLRINDSNVSLSHDYFPNRVSYLKPLVDSKDNNQLRFVMTLLTYTRSIIPTKEEYSKCEPDYTTITNPYKGKPGSVIPDFIIDEFVTKYNLQQKSKIDYHYEDHYLSSKSSPFGKATLTAAYSLFSCIEINHDLLNKYLKILGLKQYTSIIGNHIKLLFNDHRLMHIGNPLNGWGKISIVKDPELKLRCIAMVDYYSQFILKKVHNELFSLLKKIPQDRTFTQDPIFNGPSMGNSFWSLDLSAATDRFPISLQERLLKKVFTKNPDLINTWRELLTDRDYMTPKGTPIRYSVGQPMGAYSSWAAFTLTHHLVVYWASKLSKIDNFDRYILLGDDIVINNDKVARKYISIMTKLGVDISLQKTHVSKNTYEFAKRWYHHRVEITGLPLRGILSNLNNHTIVFQQLYAYYIKFPWMFRIQLEELAFKIFKINQSSKRNFTSSYLKEKIKDLHFVLRYQYKMISNDEIRLYFLNKLKNYDIEIPNTKEIPDFVRGLLVIGLGRMAEISGNKIRTYYDDFINHFSKIEDLNTLRYNPLFSGFKNKIRTMKKTLMKVSNSDDFDLIDAMNHMRLDEPDKIVESVRNTSLQISHLNKLWNHGFKVVDHVFKKSNNWDEISLLLPEPGQTSLKPWESYYVQNLSQLDDSLDSIQGGYWTKPGEITPMW
jgi:hypothetical protein